jgi:hypothetical protein
MTPQQEAAIITGIAGLAHALDDAKVKDFKLATQDLVAQISPSLPAKADGTAYTDDELAAAADAARQPFLDVVARDGQ